MKVSFYINSLLRGGAERVVCNLSSYLAEKGNDITVYTFYNNDVSYKICDKVKIKVLLNKENGNKVKDFIKRLKALYLSTKDESDVRITFLEIPTIYMLFLKPLYKTPLIISERNDPKNYSKVIRKLLKLLYTKADGYVFQTDEAKEWYDKVRNDKYRIIPNAINEEFLDKKVSISRNKNIVSVGRLYPQKNHKMLVDAFAKVADSFPDYKLILYGQGPLKDEICSQAEILGVKDRVIFAGFNENIADSIKDSALFVLPSDYEGMPNALIEAMALGIPSISTDCPCGGSRFLIDNGKNGFLVPVNDSESMAKSISDVLSNQILSEKFSKEALKIREILHPDIIYSEWENFILSIINKGK